MIDKVLEIVLVDDHAVVRMGFRLLLESSPRLKVVAELDNGEAINQYWNTNKPDVISIDISMPGMGGLEAIRRIKAKNPQLKVLVFTMHESNAFVEQALEAGADGYVVKKQCCQGAAGCRARGSQWQDLGRSCAGAPGQQPSARWQAGRAGDAVAPRIPDLLQVRRGSHHARDCQ